MVEVSVVLGLVAAIFLVTVVPVWWLLAAGGITTAVGLAFGVATGFWYHVALARALAPAGALTRRWWLRPVPLNARLDAAGRQRVMPWFYAGAVGFVITVAGIGLIALALAASVWRGP